MRINMSDFDQQIIQMHSEGRTTREIAKAIGGTHTGVKYRADKLGINFSANKVFNQVPIKEKAAEIISKYKSGISVAKLAAEYNYHYSTINNLFKINKVKYGRVLNDVDMSFFERIDNEQKAYILGFWYADGYVRDKEICLDIVDLEIIRKIKNCLNYKGKIKRVHRGGGKRRGTYRLYICKPKIAQDMIRLGCVQKKSLILKFPTPDQVPIEFLGHFLRGWFDGDGCIHYRENRKQWVIRLCGTKEFLEGIIREIGLEGGTWKHFSKTGGNTWTYDNNKKSDVAKFLSFIYADATIFLKRKHDKYIAWSQVTT